MILPSIDLMNGQAVQLIGGREKALDAGDPEPLVRRFRIAGEVAVVDLDAALGKGSNADVMKKLARMAPCRVGGGIRDARTALEWLDAGATKVVIGTAAVPDVLQKLPPRRVVAALDAYNDEVVVEGWQKGTGRNVIDRMKELRGLVGGFLVTFVEREGRMKGVDMARVKELVEVAGDARLTVAGGVTTVQEVAAIDRLGADAQVGMAIYTGRLDLADAIAAPLRSDRPDGLWPTVVADAAGVALGLVYSNLDSLREAVRLRKGVYHSRSRGLWVKGLTSGATQELLRIDLDCDRDALRFTVRQQGSGFCHENTWTCWGQDGGLPRLARRLAGRKENAPDESYTRKLLDDPKLLAAEVREEAGELADALTPEQVTAEAADLAYFLMVALAKAGIPLEELERELDQRALRVFRKSARTTDGEGNQ